MNYLSLLNKLILLVLVIILYHVILTIIEFYMNRSESHFMNSSIEASGELSCVKVLHLVLYNESQPYEQQMKSVTESYYKKFTTIDTYYYTFGNVEEITLRDNICYIPGKETYLPGILDKTIKAIKHMYHPRYNYLVRSNISTIVNFSLLCPTLHGFDYGGAQYKLYQGFDEQSGITHFKYFFTKYMMGTSIILSRSLVQHIIFNSQWIDYGVIDDFAIGHLIRHHIPNQIVKSYLEHYRFVQDVNSISASTDIFYRNKSANRFDDVSNMAAIIRYIS